MKSLEMLPFNGVGVSLGPWVDGLVELRSFTKGSCGWCGYCSDEDVARLAALPKLQAVSLDSDSITDAGARALSRAQGLREIHLVGSFTPAAVAFFEPRGRPFALSLHTSIPEHRREVRARALRLADDRRGPVRGVQSIVLTDGEGGPAAVFEFVADAAVYHGSLRGQARRPIDREQVHIILDLLDEMTDMGSPEEPTGSESVRVLGDGYVAYQPCNRKGGTCPPDSRNAQRYARVVAALRAAAAPK